jgi:hypothetical protein
MLLVTLTAIQPPSGLTAMLRAHALPGGTLRRIANRLAWIASGRIVAPTPQLDPATESAREAVLEAIRRQLQSWLDFFSSAESLSPAAAKAIARAHAPDDVQKPLELFSSRLEERSFARIVDYRAAARDPG